MSLDHLIVSWLNGFAGQWPWLDAAMVRAGHLFQVWLIVPAVLGWVWWRRREALIAGPTLAAVILLADRVSAEIKPVVMRTRPCRLLEGLHELDLCGGTYGFPSNHATNTAALAAFLQVLYPWTGWVAWPAVLLVGVSRVFLGAHFPTDIVGGWLIGGALGAGAAWLLLRWPVFRANPANASALRERRVD